MRVCGTWQNENYAIGCEGGKKLAGFEYDYYTANYTAWLLMIIYVYGDGDDDGWVI